MAANQLCLEGCEERLNHRIEASVFVNRRLGLIMARKKGSFRHGVYRHFDLAAGNQHRPCRRQARALYYGPLSQTRQQPVHYRRDFLIDLFVPGGAMPNEVCTFSIVAVNVVG